MLYQYDIESQPECVIEIEALIPFPTGIVELPPMITLMIVTHSTLRTADGAWELLLPVADRYACIGCGSTVYYSIVAR